MRTLDDLFATDVWREIVREHGTPAVIVDAEIIRERCRALKAAFPDARLFYAPKANSNPWIVQEIVSQGFGIDAVSPMEIALALRAGVLPENIVYVENSMSPADMAYAIEAGVRIVLGSLGAIARYGSARPGTPIGIRVNGDIGSSEHAFTHTAGPKSKFGVHALQLEEAVSTAARTGNRVTALQQHIGSNWLDPEPFLLAARSLCDLAETLPDIEVIDFGGGFGVPYRAGDHPLDVAALGTALVEMLGTYRTRKGRPFAIAFEPGRYLVAESSALVTRVNDRKISGTGRVFIGTDTGFNQLLRPALYGSHHEIRNLSSPGAEAETVDVCGNLCEESDYLARDRSVPQAEEGDFLAVMDVGAYGLVLASDYNLRLVPAEIMVDNRTATLIRRRRTFDEWMDQFGDWSGSPPGDQSA